jgi:hypothetical protein
MIRFSEMRILHLSPAYDQLSPAFNSSINQTNHQILNNVEAVSNFVHLDGVANQLPAILV